MDDVEHVGCLVNSAHSVVAQVPHLIGDVGQPEPLRRLGGEPHASWAEIEAPEAHRRQDLSAVE